MPDENVLSTEPATGRDGMGRDETGRDDVRWGGTGQNRMSRDGTRWSGIERDLVGLGRAEL